MPVNINLFSPWTFPSVGGTQKLVHGLAHELYKLEKPNVEVITALYPHDMDGIVIQSDLQFNYPIKRMPLVKAPIGFGKDYGFSDFGGYILKDAISYIDNKQPDFIIYTPHINSFAIQAYIAAKLSGAKFVYWPAIHLDREIDCSRSAIKLYYAADFIIANSYRESEWLIKEARVPESRILILGCGFFKDQFSEVLKLRKYRYFEVSNPLKLLTVGQIRQHKALNEQIKALEIINNNYKIPAELTVAGASFSGTNRLTEYAKKLKMIDKIEFKLNCSEKDLLTYYLDSDLFIFTSRSESFGIAVLEAIASGVFPIVYPHQVYSELIMESGFGLVAQEDSPSSLANSVSIVYEYLNESVRRTSLTEEWLSKKTWESIVLRLFHKIKVGLDTDG